MAGNRPKLIAPHRDGKLYEVLSVQQDHQPLQVAKAGMCVSISLKDYSFDVYASKKRIFHNNQYGTQAPV